MPNIAKLTLKLRTVTPLFLAGAEPRGAPELRVPSIRGELRYWLRAALGGVLGDRDLDTLRQAEEQIFGSTQRASAITIQVEHSPFEAVLFTKQRAIPTGKRSKPTGRDYLFWSMAESGSIERGNYVPPKQMIPPGTPFTLTLKSRAGVKDDENVFAQAGAALWLWLHLGGLGARSRRTAGSLCVVPPANSMDGLSFTVPTSPEEFVQFLGQGLSVIHKKFQVIYQRNVKPSLPTRFDVLHKDTCRIWVLTDSKPWTSAEQAVEAIGAALRDFRSDREPDHNAVRAFLERGTRPPTIERAAFGLPLQFRYSDGGPADVLQGSQHDRRASPLSLRVTPLASKRFVGVAVLFESALLPRREELQFQRTRKTTDPPSNYDLIRQFITEKFTAQEVKFQ